jgi:4-amino-4-deoxy-L-arabinose transferase-like glycosyltransferase
MFFGRKVFVTLVLAGILLRLGLTLIADNRMATTWRVGGDAEFYVQLASTVAQGMGFTYAHQPSAWRPPLYPLFLAGMMRVFGSAYLLATRLLQCAIGLGTVWFCWRTATRIFGEEAGRATLLIALYFPTLAVFPTELMTECLATFLAAAFFWFVLDNPHLLDRKTAVYLGLIVGLASLLRFNMAIFGLFAAWMMVRNAGWRQALPSVALLVLVLGFVVSPWIVRNERVFQGQVLFSTSGGYNALQGVLTPQGRVQPGDLDTLRRAGSWLLGDLETNGPQRLTLPSEPELDRRSWKLTRGIWEQKGWRLLPVMIDKLGYFWLSTDQLFWTHSFPWKIRAGRAAGVLLYWGLLGLAIAGWILLHAQQPATAKFFLWYALLISLIHLPFVMTGRYRIPFAEPVLVVLGGAGCVRLWKRLRLQSPGNLDEEAGAPAN